MRYTRMQAWAQHKDIPLGVTWLPYCYLIGSEWRVSVTIVTRPFLEQAFWRWQTAMSTLYACATGVTLAWSQYSVTRDNYWCGNTLQYTETTAHVYLLKRSGLTQIYQKWLFLVWMNAYNMDPTWCLIIPAMKPATLSMDRPSSLKPLYISVLCNIIMHLSFSFASSQSTWHSNRIFFCVQWSNEARYMYTRVD